MSMFAAMLLICAQSGRSQGYDTPLTNQGLDHNTQSSAASRALGGTTFGLTGQAGTMFVNPASLQSIESIQLSIGAHQRNADFNQEQHYAPLKYYSNFSLLMEGLTGLIPNPDTSLTGRNPGDTVQRPFDTIGPNWSHSKNKGLPLHALLAVPFNLGESKLVAGLGMVEYADLNSYYQNNNVLTPSILSQRPLPLPRPPTDSLPVITQWSQYARAREGAIRGYGAAISTEIAPGVSLGLSGMILSGSTDDLEQRVNRGRLTFFTNYFRLDSTYGYATKRGTSDYSGQEYTLSGTYRRPNVVFGFSVTPPTIIWRKFSTDITVDTTGTPVASKSSGEEKTKLPWRGTLGLAVLPVEKLMIGLEYEIRPYESATVLSADGTESRPWLSTSVFHVGLQYAATPWLAIRLGARGQVEVFGPEGNPIEGEPASSTVYSVGAGISYEGVHLNFAYEYSLLKYQDAWGGAVSLNEIATSNVVADISYEFSGF
jgi:hypothetical protein